MRSCKEISSGTCKRHSFTYTKSKWGCWIEAAKNKVLCIRNVKILNIFCSVCR